MQLRKTLLVALLGLVTLFGVAPSEAQLGSSSSNFAGRQAFIINNAPEHLILSGFAFRNEYSDRSMRFMRDLKWTNSGQRAITAFEVVMLFYDPFNRAITGSGGRWLVTGTNSANWSLLQPQQTNGDGLIGLSTENAFSGIVYVRAIRFEDGTVWYCNDTDVEKQIKALIPALKEVGPIDPGATPATPPR